MSGLPTVVPGRPEDLTEAARWLRRIARGDERFGDDAVAARALFARAWEGEAEEAFRSRADLMIRAADRLAPIVAEIADEVDGLGRSLHATQLGMLALRADAVRGGHAVTETGIVWSATPADVLMDHDLRLVWAKLEERHRQLLETWQAAQEHGARVLQEHAVQLAYGVRSLAFGDCAESLQHRYADTMAATAANLAIALDRARPGAERGDGNGSEFPLGATADMARALGREWGQHVIDSADEAQRTVPPTVRLGFGLANAAATPLAVWQDLESGESWTEALVSQAAGVGAAAFAGAGGGLLGSLAGPAGKVVGAAVAGTWAAGAADRWVDRRMADDSSPGEPEPTRPSDPHSEAAIKRLILDVTSDPSAGGRGGR